MFNDNGKFVKILNVELNFGPYFRLKKLTGIIISVFQSQEL